MRENIRCQSDIHNALPFIPFRDVPCYIYTFARTLILLNVFLNVSLQIQLFLSYNVKDQHLAVGK